MYLEWIQLLIMLLIILAASHLFTNAIEHVGERIGVSAGVTGSIFAAVATALPETTIPVLAVIAGTSNQTVNQEIGVGAILGAPLMLSTLSIFLVGIFALQRRGLHGKLTPEKTGYIRDLNFYLFALVISASAMFLPMQPIFLRGSVSVFLIALYVIYIVLTYRASHHLVRAGHGVLAEEALLMTRLGLKDKPTVIAAQLILSLLLLLIGAKGFIIGVEHISTTLHISALLLSLLIIPIATELPEKVNSILWIRKGKDTLAFGNLTGAMVFQGTLLPALGILLTPWQPNKDVALVIFITFLATTWLRLGAGRWGKRIISFFVNGLLYLIYLYLILT